MTAYYKIPITNQPNQSFKVSLPLVGANIVLAFFAYWNRIAGYWQLNIADDATQTSLITGLPLLSGYNDRQNLLAQWNYLNIGQLLVVPMTTNGPDSPGVDDWDKNFELLWGTP